MKLNKVLLGISLVVGTFSVLATESAPVYDLNSTPSVNSDQNSKQLDNISRQLATHNRSQVNNQRQLDEMHTEISELRGAIELHSHQLSQILERQRELYQEVGRVSEALKARPTTAPSTYSQPNSNTQVSYSNNLTENEAYDRAVNMVLKEKLYEKAIPEFRQFNQKYPQSTYAANAHYWLGQLLFNKGELAEAESEFSIVVNQFKDSSKRTDALLKLAMVAQKQSNKTKAITLYRQLIKEYPSSTAAQLAKPRLNSLSQ